MPGKPYAPRPTEVRALFVLASLGAWLTRPYVGKTPRNIFRAGPVWSHETQPGLADVTTTRTSP